MPRIISDHWPTSLRCENWDSTKSHFRFGKLMDGYGRCKKLAELLWGRTQSRLHWGKQTESLDKKLKEWNLTTQGNLEFRKNQHSKSDFRTEHNPATKQLEWRGSSIESKSLYKIWTSKKWRNSPEIKVTILVDKAQQMHTKSTTLINVVLMEQLWRNQELSRRR